MPANKHVKITISDEVYSKWPETCAAFALYTLHDVNTIYEPSSAQQTLLTGITAAEGTELLQCKQIQTTKAAIKAFGRSPSKYRGSAEALLRRIAQNSEKDSEKHSGVAPINRIVDMNNIISMQHALPCGSYNFSALCGDLCIDVGQKDEFYETINKGSMRLEDMLIIRDEKTPFGSIHADSKRAMADNCQTLLTVIFCFSHTPDMLNKALAELLHHATTYLRATINDSGIV